MSDTPETDALQALQRNPELTNTLAIHDLAEAITLCRKLERQRNAYRDVKKMRNADLKRERDRLRKVVIDVAGTSSSSRLRRIAKEALRQE
jgi:ABC-type nitrate/sulfonate/bicarbonate transport system ATPase subunit